MKVYVKIHKKILGNYSQFMPPPAGQKERAQLAVSLLDFLKLHRLEVLIPIFHLFQTVQGYGYLESIPAYYGLIWCNPNMMHILRQQILGKRVEGGLHSNAYLLSIGFESLVKLLSQQMKASVKLLANVTKIQRTAQGVKIQSNGTEDLYDLLVVGCSPASLQGILDFTHKEETLFKNLDPGSFLSTYLIECDLPPPPKGIVTYAHALHPHPSSTLVTLRYTKHFFPENPLPSNLFVSHHYTLQAGADWEAECIRELQKAMPNGRVVIHAKGPTAGSSTPYFPHYNAEGILEGNPWKLLQAQGENKTLFIGDASVFESVNAIVSYNNMLLANGTIKRWLLYRS